MGTKNKIELTPIEMEEKETYELLDLPSKYFVSAQEQNKLIADLNKNAVETETFINKMNDEINKRVDDIDQVVNDKIDNIGDEVKNAILADEEFKSELTKESLEYAKGEIEKLGESLKSVPVAEGELKVTEKIFLSQLQYNYRYFGWIRIDTNIEEKPVVLNLDFIYRGAKGNVGVFSTYKWKITKFISIEIDTYKDSLLFQALDKDGDISELLEIEQWGLRKVSV